MKSYEFIKYRLNEIRNLFPELIFRYKFNESNFTHLIEVQPVECFENNMDYIKVEANLCLEFDKLYYPESLLFLSDNSLSKIEEHDYIFSAKQFGEEIKFLDDCLMQNGDNLENFIKIESEEQYALAA